MDAQFEALLRQFQCESVRAAEEVYAQTLGEDDALKLFFINGTGARTDGVNIIVDPAEDELFADADALEKIGRFLEWPPVVLVEPWNALQIVTRAQTIHECLHVLYSAFPRMHLFDARITGRNERYALSLIDNIIEDAYIEAVGCSCFDLLEPYLKFGRVAHVLANHPEEDTASRRFADVGKQAERLVRYLNYMGGLMLYPMFEMTPPEEDIRSFVEDTRSLFEAGAAEPSPGGRYDRAFEIFEWIRPLIPEDAAGLLSCEWLERRIGDRGTHGSAAPGIGGRTRAGRAQAVARRLFVDLDGSLRHDAVPVEQLMVAIGEAARRRSAVLRFALRDGWSREVGSRELGAAALHRDIRVVEVHPKVDMNLRRAYRNVHDRYRINIDSYNARFAQLLRARVSVREEHMLFGAGVSSRNLGDVKKRWWYRNTEGSEVPDLGVLLLIDGSGSMQGRRREGAMTAAVILHEVLRKQGVKHCIAEHRAVYDQPRVNINILVDFDAREEEKYNLMRINADDNTRDAPALFWAERYLSERAVCDSKVIIVISDGLPYHAYDDYGPPVSTQDTANAVRKIARRGTEVVAVALDDEDSLECYEALSCIYPNLIACNDLRRLTGQLLGIISKLLQ